MPLIGRDVEAARLRRLLAAAVAGKGGCVAVVGEPGAGKTRLVQAVANRTAMTVRVGYALDCEVERPLGAIVDALRLRAPRAGEGRFVLQASALAAASFLMVDQVVEVVEEICADGPLLLVLEDLHWADPSTLAVLRSFGDRLSGLPLAVVVTLRPVPASSPVADTLVRVAADTIALLPLGDAAVTKLARHVLGAAPPDALGPALAAAGGNPLLVLAVLADGARAGPGGGLAHRLSELSPAALAAVRAAAVLGLRVDPAELATVLDAAPLDLIPLADAAVRAGVLVAAGEHYAFRHELYRDAVLADLTGPARRLLHLQAARALAAAGAPAADVAEHYARGAAPGDREAVRWLLDAARDVVAASPAGALRLVEVARALAGSAGHHDLSDAPGELALLHVRALAGTGRCLEAELLGRSLLGTGMTADREAALHRELAFTALMQGQASRCAAEMQRCAELTTAPAAHARAIGELAFAQFMTLDHAGATASATVATGSGDPVAQIAGDTVLGFLDLYAHRTVNARRRVHAACTLVELPGAEDAHLLQPWFVAALVHLETDDHTALHRVTRRGRDVALDRGTGWAVPGYDALAGFAALRAGLLDDAVASAIAALECLDGGDGLGVAVWCHAFLAQERLHRGDLAGAEAHLVEAERWLTREQAQLGYEQVQLARATAHERAGHPDAALDALHGVWTGLRAVGVWSPLPAVGPALARLAHGAGHTMLSVELAEGYAAQAGASGVPAVRAVAGLAAAWRDTDPEKAMAAARVAASTPRAGLAATAFADTAALLRARGRRGEAARAAAEAARRWTALGADADAAACVPPGGPPPGPRARFGVDALTTTERRVVGLVADGHANAAIAARLGVSRRTVESHVSATYRKLEVSSRVELTRLALARGIG